jgi:hypothetical protein
VLDANFKEIPGERRVKGNKKAIVGKKGIQVVRPKRGRMIISEKFLFPNNYEQIFEQDIKSILNMEKIKRRTLLSFK